MVYSYQDYYNLFNEQNNTPQDNDPLSGVYDVAKYHSLLGNLSKPSNAVAGSKAADAGIPVKNTTDVAENTAASSTNWGLWNAAAGVAGSVGKHYISDGLDTTAGNAVATAGNLAGSFLPGPWGPVVTLAGNLIGGGINSGWGKKTYDDRLARTQAGTAMLNAYSSNAGSYDALVAPERYSDPEKAYRSGWAVRDWARDKNQELKDLRRLAEEKAEANYQNNISNITANNIFNLRSNMAALGGQLSTSGSDWTNGVSMINTGGTHEENPIGGVLHGISPEGEPNLVEEGEVVYNDYVFSNRLKVPEEVKKTLGIKGKDTTFAQAAKNLQKESSERPNDPVSKNGLETSMNSLISAQEIYKADEYKKRLQEANNMFGCGGFLKRKYDYGGNLKVDKSTPMLRYMPFAIHGVNAFTDAIGLTNNPDYTDTRRMAGALENMRVRDVRDVPVGGKMKYTPLDPSYYANQVNSNLAATKAGIRNLVGGNRASLVNNLITADSAGLNKLGEAYRAGIEQNLKQKADVARFNLDIDRYNSEASMKAQAENAANDRFKAQQVNDTIKNIATMNHLERKEATEARSHTVDALMKDALELGMDARYINSSNTHPDRNWWANPYTGEILPKEYEYFPNIDEALRLRKPVPYVAPTPKLTYIKPYEGLVPVDFVPND